MTTAILTALTALCVAGLTLLGGLYAELLGRVGAVEATNRSLWAYTRGLLDLYYRHRGPGSPEPPPLPDDI